MIDNPADAVSLDRIANRPRRGIGDASLDRLRNYAELHGLTVLEALSFADEAGIAAAPLRSVKSFVTLIQSLQAQAQ